MTEIFLKGILFCSHPMQEYCVATTSGDYMRDFTRILRNKFRSGRYFKHHQNLGYLPVQSLHEGDRLEESAPSFVHTLQGSYSHAPSSNTTPVHTLPYPQRAASPESLTLRDSEFVLDSRFVNHRSISNSSSVYANRAARQIETNVEHHQSSPLRQQKSLAESVTNNRNVSNANDSHLSSPIINNSSEDVHSRLGHFASRLAQAELFLNDSSRAKSDVMANKFDSLPSKSSYEETLNYSNYGDYSFAGARHSSTMDSLSSSHQYNVVQNPTEMLTKLAADQRSELELIIQRLQEENRWVLNFISNKALIYFSFQLTG